MMMGSPTTKESLKIRSILQDFSDASSTFINTKKSKIFFFNTPLAIQNHITCILGFSRSSLPSNYMGVPLVDNNLRINPWEPLITSLQKRLKSRTV
jgi:hypothetical protein